MPPSPQSTTTPRNLLLCFDAFGTLFKPRAPIAQQYADVARSSFGLKGFTDEDVGREFRKAFKKERERNPNYGKGKGGDGNGDVEGWWGNIITNTFRPLLSGGSQEQALPKGMVKALIHRFSSKEAYTLFPDVQPLLQTLRAAYNQQRQDQGERRMMIPRGRLVIGIITNSDDRVPDILTSLGLRVRSLRAISHLPPVEGLEEGERGGGGGKGKEYDIDFCVMSYDVGIEKPNREIFDEASRVVPLALKAQDGGGGGGGGRASGSDYGREASGGVSSWERIYVGDEYEKDVVGALGAGWKAVLIEREGHGKWEGVEWLDDEKPVGNLEEVFERSKAVGFESLEKFGEWLLRS